MTKNVYLHTAINQKYEIAVVLIYVSAKINLFLLNFSEKATQRLRGKIFGY